ncbi:ABC transporter ATP-binding protein [Paenibacillus baekrokdamisoli]|uniref:ABC transporter ATP-binding protein n=1 Tax=Paenibacillus baekrokdamisoli TaxID=1712516 RepID=A0A3G9IZJ5_9BACL|nr:ABC transporter ATP-binding protein [Paenibacillus baekrokdamisoli]MBB3073421.1 ABC-type multidrug transport system fused ATPase/permease subunit [Paenibacillus baekrokdamisoli]BBH24357.1 ABC transporter ATP-binding protein [Paenibacillus baekrokdamisoli]
MNSGETTSVWKHWPIILRFMKPYWIAATFVFILLFGDALFDWSVAYSQGFFIDSIKGSNQKEIIGLTLIMTAALFGFVLLLTVHRYLLVWLNNAVYKEMSLHLFGLINRMPFSFVQKQLSGDIVLRVKEDTKHGTDLIEAAVEFITVIFIIALSFGYLLKVDRLLAVVAILSVIAIFFCSRFFDGRLRTESANVEAGEAVAQHKIQEYMNGISVIKHYEAAKWFLGRFTKHQMVLNRGRSKLAMTESMADNTAMAVFYMTQLVALSIIALSAARESLTPGMVVACSLLFELVVWPVLGLSRQWSRMQEGAGAFGRIYDWMRMEPEISRYQKQPDILKEQEPVLKLSDVQFMPAESETPVLNGITMEVNRGEIIAVVGPSGAGKSTLCKLCAGLYEPTIGEVLLSSRSASDQLMEENDVVTYVSQTPAFFAGKVRDNIVLNKQQVSENELIQAAESAALHSVVDGLDGKYDAPIKERGLNLSGGQRQRLSLSRVFLRESELYIFDEPTSSLDIQTEQEVMHNLLSFLEGKTAVIVTHKMELAKLASRILVMDRGRIVEAGTHEELMQQRKLYYKLNTA